MMVASSFPPGLFFFFNDTATTEIYTLSLHDALPISPCRLRQSCLRGTAPARLRSRASLPGRLRIPGRPDRKSTRLNSSHSQISYAVFCLKKKTWPDNDEDAEAASSLALGARGTDRTS